MKLVVASTTAGTAPATAIATAAATLIAIAGQPLSIVEPTATATATVHVVVAAEREIWP